MADIKLINKDTDLSNISKLDWDSYFGDTPLQVYRVEDCYHGIGGRYGNNNLWCCKRGEEPTYDNLMEFSGNPCNWGIKIIENNYHKCKWEEHEIMGNTSVTIMRNNEKFYSFPAGSIDYGFTRARMLLYEIESHPIDFNIINFEKHIINRDIYFENMPCKIISYNTATVLIEPDLDCMTKEEWNKNLSEYYENEECIPENIFADSIKWFREKE